MAAAAAAKSLQSCLTLCDPIDGSPPGSSVPGILQYSCLENPMDRGAWWATVHGVPKSQTRLSDFTFSLPSKLSRVLNVTYSIKDILNYGEDCDVAVIVDGAHVVRF